MSDDPAFVSIAPLKTEGLPELYSTKEAMADPNRAVPIIYGGRMMYYDGPSNDVALKAHRQAQAIAMRAAKWAVNA